MQSKQRFINLAESKVCRVKTHVDVVHGPLTKYFYDESRPDSPYSITQYELWLRTLKIDRGHFGHQLFVCVVVTLGSIVTGYTMGLTSPMIRQQANEHKGVYNPHQGRFAAIVAMGFAAGSTFMTTLTMARGPRIMMLTCIPMNIVCWLVGQLDATHSTHKGTMFFNAFFSVAYHRCGTLLLTDGIHEEYYYIFFLIFNSGFGFGILLANIIGYHSVMCLYRDAIGCAILCVLFGFLFLCPESPVILFKKSPLQAKKAVVFFRGNENINLLLRQLKKDYDARVLTISTKYMIFYRVVYKPLLIIITFAMLQCFYAYTIFIMYDFSLWYTIGRYKSVDIIGQHEDGIIIGVAYCLCPLIAQSVNLRMTYGLWKPIMWSAVLVPISLTALSIFYYVLFHTAYLDHCAWLIFVVRIVHIICVNLSGDIILDIMIADYLPEQVQTWATACIHTVKFTWLAFLLWFAFLLENEFGASFIVGIFALISLGGIPFCYYFIIESKGRTLQQVQIAIGGNPIGTRSSFRNRYRNYINIK